MTDLLKGRLAIKYITFEIVPVFILGMIIFIFVLVMFQSFKLSEYIIVHGAQLNIIFKLVFYMTLGFLPILFPIALLFSVLMVYGRLSSDSEIVAFKALGLSPKHLVMPILIVGASVSILSLQTSFRLAPWGNRQFSELVNVLAATRPGVAIREGVFSEGFFDLVVYANTVDSKTGLLKNIFIYDERNPKSPVTIIAKEGHLINSNSLSGQKASLRLINGDLHKPSNESYTKIDFGTYDINLFDPHEIKEGRLTSDALNFSELRTALENKKYTKAEHLNFAQEWHRRWAISATCLIFAFIGYSIGTVTNRRSARSSSLVVCISVIVIYWAFQVGFEALVRNAVVPPSVGAWLANVIFLIFGIVQFRRLQNS